MAGRGRGVGAFTFNIEALGIGRGSMPEARVGPNPLFPVSTNDLNIFNSPIVHRKSCIQTVKCFSTG